MEPRRLEAPGGSRPTRLRGRRGGAAAPYVPGEGRRRFPGTRVGSMAAVSHHSLGALAAQALPRPLARALANEHSRLTSRCPAW